MAKKKKPAANVNRGFATTSIASKAKIDSGAAVAETLADANNESSGGKKDIPEAHALSKANGVDKELKELHELTPEELETRLEEEELQTIVEKFGAKSVRDSSRSVNKLQTEYRVLRKQAQPLQILGLLPLEILQQILNFAKEDGKLNTLATLAPRTSRQSLLKEDETAVQLWTLHRALKWLGFSSEFIASAIDYILQSPPPQDSVNSIWGLDEVLDWLFLNTDDSDLPEIEESTGLPKLKSKDSIGPNIALEIENGPELSSNTTSQDISRTNSFQAVKMASRTPIKSPSPDEIIDVSDLDSDLEPDELLAKYLDAKARLYEMNPNLVDARNGKLKAPATSSPSKDFGSGALKLQQKLQKIESDVLFDKREAEDRWIMARNRLAQEVADRRRLRLTSPSRAPDGVVATPAATPLGTLTPASSDGTIGTPSEFASDGDNVFADLFSATVIGDPEPSSQNVAGDTAQLVRTIKDFGQTIGVSPRRILEEACRARDPRVKILYKLISTTAFSNRHMIVLTWTKEQDIDFPLDIQDVKSQSSPKSCVFAMQSIATTDSHQSEAYISVVALFQIFSISSKEEKTYLRLPAKWRDLYLDLLHQRRLKTELEDRETIRGLRDKVRSHLDSQTDPDDGDVIHTRNFKKRNEDIEGIKSRPNGLDSESLDSQQLKDIWAIKSSTPAYQRMLVGRKTLPMFQFREAALAAISANQVIIICGETGCGKSTQVPSFILEHELQNGRACKVYCTEPRRISAITLAQRVSQELGENKNDIGTLRSLVGFAIRLESQTSRSTRLTYATTGIVLRMLESGDGLKDVTHIVIDEVHERRHANCIETDFLLIVLRSLMIQRPDLKVILMSATVDAQRFAKYFDGAPILNVPGRTFPVEHKFLEDAIQLTRHVVDDNDSDQRNFDDDEPQEALPTTPENGIAKQDYLAGYSAGTRATLTKFDEYRLDYGLLLNLVQEIAYGAQYQHFGKAILIFLPGIGEIRRLLDVLQGSNVSRDYIIHSLHSAIPSEDQQKAFDPPPQGMGKIIVSTNIAETGVTIPDVTCVIDTGKHKEMRFDERRQISRLIESFISRANAKQRRGRAGRVQPGLCFHLFTKQRHDTGIASEQTPEMLRLSLQDLVMRVKICKLGDIQTILADALDPPSSKNVRRAIDALIEVGALTSKEELTVLGQQLSKLPLDPYLGKLVLHGTIFGCLDIALTIAAILTSKPPFNTPIDARQSATTARTTFIKSDSDLLTDYNAYASWRRVCMTNPQSEAQFCRRNFLSSQTLSNIEDLKAQLLSALADGGIVSIPPASRQTLSRVQHSSGRGARRAFVEVPAHLDANSEAIDLVLAIIAWSFYPKLLIREGKGWRNIGTNQSIYIHPTSVLRGVTSESFGRVKFLSFYSILQSTTGARNYNASSLTPVAALPLVLLAGDTAFVSYSCVLTVDGARLRFLVEGNGKIGAWKTVTALKFLRRRLEEIVQFKIGSPQKDLPTRLRRWLGVWERLLDAWVERDRKIQG